MGQSSNGLATVSVKPSDSLTSDFSKYFRLQKMRDGLTVWRFEIVKFQEWRFLLHAENQSSAWETVKPSQNNQSGWPDSIWRNEQNSPEYDSGLTDKEGRNG